MASPSGCVAVRRPVGVVLRARLTTLALVTGLFGYHASPVNSHSPSLIRPNPRLGVEQSKPTMVVNHQGWSRLQAPKRTRNFQPRARCALSELERSGR